MNHHKIYYPVSKLIDKKPYKTGYIYNIPDGLLAYGPSLFLILSLLYFLFDFYTLVSEILLFAFLSDYIHTEIHIDGSWLEKYEWFLKKRKLHLLHHKKFMKNMNIIDHTFDKLKGTYLEN